MIRIFTKLALSLLLVTGPISCAQVSSVRSFERPSSVAAKDPSFFEISRPVGLSQRGYRNGSCSIQTTRGLELILSPQCTNLLELAVEKHDPQGSKAVTACFLETEFVLDSIVQIAAEPGLLNMLEAARAWYRNGTANLDDSTVQLHECLEWIEECTGQVGQ